MLHVLTTALFAVLAAGVRDAPSPQERLPEEEVIYFLLPDRFENGDASNDEGGIEGGRLDHGFDPSDPAFYHGGDLAGLTSRLDYIRGLGATAIWLGPVYGNKAVQGPPGREGAGYHGYWITDFTGVDPHFGTRGDMKRFVDAAHERGMKVYLDIVVNHTADVIRYEECDGPGEPARCSYRGAAAYPYTTEGPADGRTINEGFEGDTIRTKGNFAALDDPRWALTPYVPSAERAAKTPSWLNDPIHYHNRGDTTFEGESSLLGDFLGLDDLFTESPAVTEGMIEIYADWVRRYRIDGFRVDTARHVEPGFWHRFIPDIEARAARAGIGNFHIFGEVAVPDAGILAAHTRENGFPSVLDFALQHAIVEVVARGEPTAILADVFSKDVLYEGGEATARRLPTFVGNHDDGRFAHHVAMARPDAPEAERLARVKLAHAILFAARGIPVIYSGAEQGFVGDGAFEDAREDMFESRAARYNDNDLLGTDATTAAANFDETHPLYRFIAELAAIRAAEPALRRGRQVTRLSETEGGLFAFSRLDQASGTEVVMVLNAGTTPREAFVSVEPRSTAFSSLHGDCPESAAAQGSLAARVPAMSFVLCRARTARSR